MDTSKNIKEYNINDKLSLSVYNIKGSNLVTMAGSFPGGALHAKEKNHFIPQICASMLEKGTSKMTKEKIAEEKESLGVSTSFSVSSKFTNFDIKTRKENIKPALKLLKEVIYNANFPKKELNILKKNLIDSLEEEKENTRKISQNALKRSLFKKGHPNYAYSIEEKIKLIQKIKPEDLKDFHKKYYGLSNINLAAAGSVGFLKENIFETFKNIKEVNAENVSLEFNTSKLLKNSASEQFMNIPDKDSADIFLGRALPFYKYEKDYLPTLLAISILGNGFMARLMKNVRDKKGLTYGTTSRLAGFEEKNEGFWFAFGMFSPPLLEKGIDAIKEEIKIIFKKGITNQELKDQKTHLVGLYKLSLSNTEGLAKKILQIKEEGLEIKEIDELVNKVEAIKKEEVEEVIKKYFNPEDLSLSVAGTIPKNFKK